MKRAMKAIVFASNIIFPVIFASIFLTACVSQMPLLAQTPALAASISVLPQPGLSLVENSTYRYSAGNVDTIITPQWKGRFTLQNTTKQPVTISRLRGSCGCETLLLLKDGDIVPTVHLAPGEQAAVHLKVNLHSGQIGPVRKYVWIDGSGTASGQSAPLATLEVDIIQQQSVTFVPASLNFGKVEAGAGASRPLAISWDPDLLHGANLPALSSSSSDIKARPIGALQRIIVDGKPRLQQAYQVMLSPSAHAGSLSDELWLDLPLPTSASASAASPGTELNASKLNASRLNLIITGEVSGALDALPASVFFGSFPASKSVTRSVVLSLSPSSIGKKLFVTSSALWVHAILDQSATFSNHRLLSVTLIDQAPIGPIQEKITVSLSGGGQLDIPVIAERTK